MDERTLADVGEFGLIGLLAEVVGAAAARVEVGVGDDAAVVAVPSGRVVAAVDQMVEGKHFRRDWSSGHDVGRKAAARSMSDIAAMGAVPTALLVTLAAPGDLPVAWVLELAAGLAEEAGLVGAAVAGGDTGSSAVLTITVTALGDAGPHPLVLRSGARPGDGVYLAGRTGRAAGGLAVLSRGHRSPRALVAAHRVPEPPYAAGTAAAAAGATAMIDVSDGLVADAGHIARASAVVLDLNRDGIGMDPELEAMARNLGADAWDWVLAGGEDHALLATFAEGASVPVAFRRIGTVAAAAESGPGVLLEGMPAGIAGGHEHFR